jgi:hypothetical protein
MNRIFVLTAFLLLISMNTLWSQDSLVTVNNMRFPAEVFDRSGTSLYISFGSAKNTAYVNTLDDYLTTYYDNDSLSHQLSRRWGIFEIGLEVPLDKRLKLCPNVGFYRTTHKLNERNESHNPWWPFTSTHSDHVTDRLIVPSLGLKYNFVSEPGAAVFVQGDAGYPIGRPASDGYEYVATEGFDYKANGPKLGFLTGLDVGSKAFSVAASLGYVYLPMRFENYYLKRSENFGGFRFAFTLKTHF